MKSFKTAALSSICALMLIATVHAGEGIKLGFGFFAKNLDAYAQIIPRLRLNNNSDFGLDFGIGVRYQF